MRRLVPSIVVLALLGCNSEDIQPTSNTPVPQAPVVSATPTPAPVATPAPTAPSSPSFELWGTAPSTLNLTYTGEASKVKVTTFYTSFDNQDLPFALQEHTINKGDTLTRAYGIGCIQADADQPGVKLIGGVWFDINQKPFSPSKNPEKITECRNQCTPRWLEIEERSEGDWVDYTPENVPSTVEQKCYKHQRRLIILFEQNSCTKEKRELRRFFETREVEIPCPCINVPTTRIVDDWGPWSGPDGVCGHRSGVRTTYTLNSCTQQETSVESPLSEDKDCPFCHVSAHGTPTNSQDLTDETIQVNVLNFPYPAGNPGHNTHLSAANQCPQDFWVTPNKACTGSSAQSEILGTVCTEFWPVWLGGACKKREFTCVVQ